MKESKLILPSSRISGRLIGHKSFLKTEGFFVGVLLKVALEGEELLENLEENNMI